jgi:hypothetical protein
LNPSVISVGKIAWRHHTVVYFQTNCIFRRRNRRKYSVGIYRWIYRRNKSVGIYRQLWRRNYFRRYILPTEKFRR